MRMGALTWLGVAVLASVTLAAGGHEHARAEGAIAVGSTGNVKRDGIAFGLAYEEAAGTAGEIAVSRCRTFEAKAAANRCQVVAVFSGECFAIAYDPQPGTPGAGWGVGPDQLVANQKAVAMCEEVAGPDRKGYCQVERFGCDSGPKLAPKSDAGEAPKPETKPDANPGATPGPAIDAKTAPEGKPGAKDATASGEGGEKARGAKKTSAEAPPPSAPKPAPETRVKPMSATDGAGAKKREEASSPLLPVMALAGVGLAYAAGQHLRGRTKGGVTERQIITGGALAVLAAIAVKLLDLLGADATVSAALASLIAVGAALLA